MDIMLINYIHLLTTIRISERNSLLVSGCEFKAESAVEFDGKGITGPRVLRVGDRGDLKISDVIRHVRLR